MTPLVSCVVVTHQYGRFVARAVESVLAQTGLPEGALEIIVVDDGSTDDTPQILAGFGDAITVIRQENQGPSVARNRGMRAARGEFVALLDADDEWLPDKLARQLAVLTRRPEVGLVHGDMEVVDDAGEVLLPSKFALTGQPVATGRVLGRLIAVNQATTSAIMLRRGLLDEIELTPDWAWCDDWWLSVQVAAIAEIDCVPRPVARYRQHGENFSATADPARAARLAARDFRVRATLLRTVDLGPVEPLDLLAAWHEQQALVALLPERPTADPAAADALATEAAATLGSDPAHAVRLAVRALATDPANGAATAVLAEADEALTPADELEALRADLRDAEPALHDLVDVVQAMARLEALAVRPPVLTEAERDRALGAAATAVALRERGDLHRALFRFANAAAFDPDDVHARLGFVSTLHELRDGVRPPGSPAPPQAPSALSDARAFVALAHCDELTADPELLHTWAAAFTGDDDATLAIYAPDGDPAAIEPALTGALAAAGIGADDTRDLLALVVPATAALERDLVQHAHAVLTARPARPPFDTLPPLDDARALRAAAERRWNHDGLGRPVAFAITFCAPTWAGADGWGDLHYAKAIAVELERRGHVAHVLPVDAWDSPLAQACDVTLHLRGLYPFVPRTEQLSLLWNISHPARVTPRECDRYDVVFTPSARTARELAARTTAPVAVLEQATDAAVFFPGEDPDLAHELVFVGNSRGELRPILRDLLPTDRDLAIWGHDWERFIGTTHLRGAYLENDRVRGAYSSAGIVLNDHWDDMREAGIVSNRIYDALACGAVVVSDHLDELDTGFAGTVTTYRDGAELPGIVDALLADPAGRREIARRGRELVLARHTFARRVDVLLDTVRAHLAVKSADERPMSRT